MLKSVFYKLVFVLVLLVAWIIYGYRHVIMNAWYDTTDAVERTADNLGLIPEEEVTKTAVYKWTDENGQVHYTSSPPPAGIEAETQSYSSNVNIIESVKTRPKTPESEAKPKLLGNLPELMEQARQAKELANQSGTASRP